MKVIDDFKLVRKRRLTPYYFVLELTSANKLPAILPGQFVEIKVDNSKSTFLRRPFSIHDVDYKENIISILVQIVGEGSKALSYVEEGNFINMILPLGNSFSIPQSNEILMIGGGCGVAPLLYLSKFINLKGIRPQILIGAKSKGDIHRIDEFEKYGDVFLITDDGSAGEKGLITQHSIFRSHATKIDKIYLWKKKKVFI